MEEVIHRESDTFIDVDNLLAKCGIWHHRADYSSNGPSSMAQRSNSLRLFSKGEKKAQSFKLLHLLDLGTLVTSELTLLTFSIPDADS